MVRGALASDPVPPSNADSLALALLPLLHGVTLNPNDLVRAPYLSGSVGLIDMGEGGAA